MVRRASLKLGPPAQVELVIGTVVILPISASIRDLLLRPLGPCSGQRNPMPVGVTFDDIGCQTPRRRSRVNPRGTEPRQVPSHRGRWPIFGSRSGEPPAAAPPGPLHASTSICPERSGASQLTAGRTSQERGGPRVFLIAMTAHGDRGGDASLAGALALNLDTGSPTFQRSTQRPRPLRRARDGASRRLGAGPSHRSRRRTMIGWPGHQGPVERFSPVHRSPQVPVRTTECKSRPDRKGPTLLGRAGAGD
jgi:hypothetical protein